MERARNSAPAPGKERRCISSSQVSCRWLSRLSGSGTSRLQLRIQHSYLVQFTLQVVGENHEEYEKLATELTNMANTLAPYVTKLIAEDISGSVARIIE